MRAKMILFPFSIMGFLLVTTQLLSQSLQEKSENEVWVFKHNSMNKIRELEMEQKVRIRLFNPEGKKTLQGKFKGLTETSVLLYTSDNSTISIPKENVERINIKKHRPNKLLLGVLLILLAFAIPPLGFAVPDRIGCLIALASLGSILTGIILIIGSSSALIDEPFGGAWTIGSMMIP